jgi:hypothetical protein
MCSIVARACAAFAWLSIAATVVHAAPSIQIVPGNAQGSASHLVLSGRPTTLKAVVGASCAGVCQWRWTPGDGSAPIDGNVDADPIDPSQLDDVDYTPYWAVWAEHTYTGDAGDVFIAKLRVSDGVETATATYRVEIVQTALQHEVNAALDEALWFMHRNQFRFDGTDTGNTGGTTPMGRWDYPQTFGQAVAAVTASSVQAFESNGYSQSGDTPYAETVRRGLRYAIARLASRPLSIQTVGDLSGNGRSDDPDTNGNGIGVSVDDFVGFIEHDGPSQNGMLMGALAASGTPSAVAITGNSGVKGQTYREIERDMSDWYAWAQSDSTQHGGWQYGPFDNSGGTHDNAASGLAALGLVAARDAFSAPVPGWVKERNANGLEFTDNEGDTDDRDGIHGYSSQFEIWGPFAVTGAALVQMALDDVQSTSAASADERWIRSENYFRRHFDDTAAGDSFKNYYFGMFNFANGMRLARPAPVVDIGTRPGAANGGVGCGPHPGCAPGGPAPLDWYNDRMSGLARTIVDYQILPGDPDTEASCGAPQPGPCPNIGSFTDRPGNSHGSNQDDFDAPWPTQILTRSLLTPGPIPFAEASPGRTAEGVPVALDASRSYDADPRRTIIAYEWDFDDDGVFDASGLHVQHRFACTPTGSVPCKIFVTLRVTDDGDPALTAEDTVIINVTHPPHPPVARAGGPYLMCIGEHGILQAGASSDIDTGHSETGEPPFDEITAYDWDLNLQTGAPFDEIDVQGAHPTVRFFTAYTRDVALRVTDNTALAYPSSGRPDLTDSAATTLSVVDCACMGRVVGRPLTNVVQLVWQPVPGAASYDIYRATELNSGYVLRGDDVAGAPFLDPVGESDTYWYRITPHDANGSELCGSSLPARVVVAAPAGL